MRVRVLRVRVMPVVVVVLIGRVRVVCVHGWDSARGADSSTQGRRAICAGRADLTVYVIPTDHAPSGSPRLHAPVVYRCRPCDRFRRFRPLLKARQKLGKYRIERRISDGSAAAVYEAVDTIHGTHVALKIPHESAMTDSFSPTSSARRDSPIGSSTRTSCRSATRRSSTAVS